MTDKTNIEEQPLVDDAGRKFAADVAEIMEPFMEALKKLAAEREQALAEAERIKIEAPAKYERAFRAERGKYAALVRKSAEKWASESEHPENIEKVCEEYVRPLEYDIGCILAPSCIIKKLEWQEQTRRDIDENNRKWKALVTRSQRTYFAGEFH